MTWTSQENKKKSCNQNSRLRLPITDKADVWGQGVALLELYSGRPLGRSREGPGSGISLSSGPSFLGVKNPLAISICNPKVGGISWEIFPKVADAFFEFFLWP